MERNCYSSSPNQILIPKKKKALSGHNTQSDVIVWDYHVIAIKKTEKECLVFDFDSIHQFPSQFEEYFKNTFKTNKPKYLPFFRVLTREEYLKYLSSDRSHMYDKVKKEYLSPPPNYNLIYKKHLGNNLFSHFVTCEKGYGEILDLNQFKQKFEIKK